MATHSSILVWEIPWTEKSGGLQSKGLQRIRHDRKSTFFPSLFPLLSLSEVEVAVITISQVPHTLSVKTSCQRGKAVMSSLEEMLSLFLNYEKILKSERLIGLDLMDLSWKDK